MSPYMSEKNVLSSITIGSLEDLGYSVNYAAAEPFWPSDIGICTGCGTTRRLRRLDGESNTSPHVSKCREGQAYENAVKYGRDVLNKIGATSTSKSNILGDTGVPKVRTGRSKIRD
jgi:hypothetical protein